MELPPVQKSYRQWEAEAQARIAKGEQGLRVEHDLIIRGLDAPTARKIVDEAVATLRKKALWLLIGGGIAALVGLVITVAAFIVARETDQNIFGCGWLAIFGGILAVVGLVRLLRIQR